MGYGSCEDRMYAPCDSSWASATVTLDGKCGEEAWMCNDERDSPMTGTLPIFCIASLIWAVFTTELISVALETDFTCLVLASDISRGESTPWALRCASSSEGRRLPSPPARLPLASVFGSAASPSRLIVLQAPPMLSAKLRKSGPAVVRAVT